MTPHLAAYAFWFVAIIIGAFLWARRRNTHDDVGTIYLISTNYREAINDCYQSLNKVFPNDLDWNGEYLMLVGVETTQYSDHYRCRMKLLRIYEQMHITYSIHGVNVGQKGIPMWSFEPSVQPLLKRGGWTIVSAEEAERFLRGGDLKVRV